MLMLLIEHENFDVKPMLTRQDKYSYMNIAYETY